MITAVERAERLQLQQRRYTALHVRRVQRAIARANAPGKDERIAAAAAKRERKNLKRI